MAAPGHAHIQIEGYKEFQRALRHAEDKSLPKAIGEVHRDVGKFIVSKLEPRPQPEAVGAGAGASVRASATKRELLLRVGGGHRNETAPYAQWGKTHVGAVGKGAPPRPYIIQTALAHEDEIRQRLLDGVVEALSPAFHSAE